MALSGDRLVRCKCLLLTQNGHRWGLSLCRFEPLRCPVLSLGEGNEAARIYQSSCWVGSSLAACGVRAAAGNSGRWISGQRNAGKIWDSPQRIPARPFPVVFETGLDPIAAGLAPKGLELLHELVPQANSLAVIVNPANPVNTDTNLKNLEAPARARGLQLHVLNASTERDFDAAFARLVQLHAGGLVVAPDIIFNSRAQQLAALTLKHAVPAVHTVREFAVAGGLMSYGGNIRETHRQAGIYTGRILKGERPSDLPVQQVTKVEFVINLKTAKALGLTVPNTLIGRADEVIE
jgi:ABC transporter substrate binding protein